MPNTINIAIEYLDQVQAKLAAGTAAPELRAAIGVVLNNIWQDVAQYPPSTEANQPGRFSIRTHKPMGYYERGRGWWYPVMQRTTLGSSRGKGVGSWGASKALSSASGIAGYKLAGGGKSEALGRHWAMQMSANSREIRGRLINSASYAGYVQGDLQNTLHRKRGWQTVSDVVERLRVNIAVTIQAAVIDFLKR